ncbi:MAG TPA: methionine adenosyltransferase [Burkholderiales bacterium]|nr:methionine adenosyltransferase [Burkholderiales bacterium]
MPVSVTALLSPSPGSLPFEIVERKGLGHPDTICDALVENLSTGLGRAYLERFGSILHHNVDIDDRVTDFARRAGGTQRRH